MAKLLVVDGNALLHRAYHAIPLLTTRKGKPVNALYGLASMLFKAIETIGPTHIISCFDRKEPTFRHKIFKEYQAQRPKMDETLSSQFELTKEFFNSFGIPVVEKPGFEADDLIGTISDLFVKRGYGEVVILTGDRDILQLVKKDIYVCLLRRGTTNMEVFDTEKVKRVIGVKPNMIPYLKALTGDSSDNYKGVGGIGPKTAISLLEKYENIKSIYKNLDKLDKSLSEKLRKEKKNVYLYLDLATIRKNVELKVNFDEAMRWKERIKNVLSFFRKVGFKSLSNRLLRLAENLKKSPQLKLL